MIRSSAALALALALVVTACGDDESGGTTEPDPNQPPTAIITAPSSGLTVVEGDDVEFTGSGTDPEDGTLSGSQLAWASDVDGDFGVGSTLSYAGLSVGDHLVSLRVVDTGGLADTASVSVTVEMAPPEAPVVSIASPTDGQTFTVGEEIDFVGGADRDVTLEWASSLDGVIGTSTLFARSDLTAGAHVITFTATTTEGGVGADTLNITVN